jgi:hypothetical protein
MRLESEFTVMKYLLIVMLTLGLSNVCLAEDHAPAKHDSATTKVESHGESKGDDQPHPSIPADPFWVPQMIKIIGGMFLAAIAVGLIYKVDSSSSPMPHDDEHHGHDSHGHDAHGHNAHGHDAHGHGSNHGSGHNSAHGAGQGGHH